MNATVLADSTIPNHESNHELENAVAKAALYQRFYEREKQARREAEQWLEVRSQELYLSNQKLASAATELERQVQRYNAVFETAAEGIVIFDNQGNIESLNQAGVEIFGLSDRDVQNVNICELIPSVRRLLDSASKNPTAPFSFENDEVSGIHLDGVEIPLEFFISQFSHMGAITYSGIFRDLTSRRVLEQKLTHAQKMKSVGQLAAGVAHELNTPIQFVSDNTSFLKSSFEDLDSIIRQVQSLIADCQQQGVSLERAESIAADCERLDLEFIRTEIPLAAQQTLQGTETLARIVKAMRVFSHPGNHEFVDVDLNQAIESTLTVSKGVWKYHVSLETDFCRDLSSVRCLPAELNQVFLNLIVNAVDAMRDNGPSRAARLLIRTYRQNKFAVIEISDTGHGIPDSIQHRIFDPFFTTKAVGEGTGQGLAICYDIVVELHGGKLTFESNAQTGTTFKISLPQPTSH